MVLLRLEPLPKRQLGNIKPSVLDEKDQALINRLGFNNHGSEQFFKELLKICRGFESMLVLIKTQKIKRKTIIYVYQNYHLLLAI